MQVTEEPHAQRRGSGAQHGVVQLKCQHAGLPEQVVPQPIVGSTLTHFGQVRGVHFHDLDKTLARGRGEARPATDEL